MEDISSYILSAYSFIYDHSSENLLDTGYRSKNGNPIPSFDEKLLIDLCSKAEQIFAKESSLLELEGDFIIVGDIHGSLHDLLRILHFISNHNSKVLFLGDYVDRGNFSLECITILFALKVSSPEKFYLIRGNHEFDSICCQYGFKNEILDYNKCIEPLQAANVRQLRKSTSVNFYTKSISFKDIQLEENLPLYTDSNCYKYTEALYNAFIKAFSYLPIAATLNSTTFCIHGGLSPKLHHTDDINKLIKRPIERIEDNILLSDVMWSDPSHSMSRQFDENPRGLGYLFNGESVSHFLKANSLKRLIRAHQCIKKGFLQHFIDKCVTIFSASSYDYPMGNHSSILQLFQEDDTIHPHTFNPLVRLEKSETYYYKVQSPYSKEGKSHVYFSLLHPKLITNVNSRIHISANLKQAQLHKSSSNLHRNISHNVSYHSKLVHFSKPKFVTNQRKSLQYNISQPSFIPDAPMDDGNEDKTDHLNLESAT